MEFVIPARRDRPSDDPIFALNSEAKQRAARGEDVLNATVGALLDDDGKLAVLPTVAETLRQVPASTSAAYAEIAGSPDFLRAVVLDLLGNREAASQTAVVATPGGTGALRHAIANFLEPGQAILTSSFYWGPYKTLADEADRGFATFNMFDESGGLDVASFEEKLRALLATQKRALVFLNSPCHNPTGYSFDEAEWKAIVETASRSSELGPITIVLDVAYARYGKTDLSEHVDRVLASRDRVQICFAWSASKSFTEYGLRVGALLAVQPDPEQRRRTQNALVYSCRGTWSNCNAGGMAAIARILSDPELKARVDRERADLKAILDRRVARWNELASARGLRYPRYDGGFFTTVFCDNAHDVAARVKEDGIFVVPQTGALRVALCSVAEKNVARLVDGLAKHAL